MSKLFSFVMGASLLAGAGCGTDGPGDSPPGTPELLPNLMVPEAPTAGTGFQVITPIVRGLEPGSDHEICTWTDAYADTQLDVKSTIGFQTEPGHHIVVYYTMEKQPPGLQRECTDSDMVAFRMVTGNGKEGEVSEAPGNLVFRIPQGAQIVINHHYLNATDEMMDGQSVVNVNFAAPGGNYIASGATAFLNSALVVAQGDTTQKQHCVVARDTKLWFLTPHMHAWGKHIKVDITHDAETSTKFDVNWDPSFAFHPPELRLDPSTPMILHQGDSVDTTCEWNNDAGRDLTFGFEMCVTFGQTVDDTNQGNIACDDGHWGPF